MNTILSLAIFLILGFGARKLFQKIKFPIVTAYLILGIIIGPFCLNLVAPQIFKVSGIFSEFVLGMIAFSIGGNFSIASIKRIGRTVLLISIFECALACTFVLASFTFLLKKPFHTSILFGSIAAATAPAATVAVIREYKAKGILTSTLLGVVAIDDAWGLILFAGAFAISKVLWSGTGIPIPKVFGLALLRVIGALSIGAIIGWLLSYFAKFLRTREETLIYTLGFILLAIGVSKLLNVSVLLTSMALGFATINFGGRGRRFLDIIESVDAPLLLMFFVLVGAELEITALKYLGILGSVYLVTRVMGKFIGTYIGVKVAKAEPRIRWLGLGLVPQAGVALGMALYVKAYFPELGGLILPVIIGSTIVYELIGPLCTKLAISRAGEISRGVV